MDCFKSSIPRGEFLTGNGTCDSRSKPIIPTWQYSWRPYKGLTIHAAANNTANLYVGRQVATTDGFQLQPGDSIKLETDWAESVAICSDTTRPTIQTVTVTDASIDATFRVAGVTADATITPADLATLTGLVVTGEVGSYTIESPTGVTPEVVDGTATITVETTQLSSDGSAYSWLCV